MVSATNNKKQQSLQLMRAEQVDIEVEVEVEVVRTQMTVRNPRAARKISRTICSAMAMILLSATPRSSEAFTASSTSISTSASMSAYGSVNGNVKAAFSPFERSSSFTTGSSTRTTMTGRGRNAAAPTSTSTCTSTQLQMSLSTAMAPLSTATGVAAVFGALSGGLFSGSLHAISGESIHYHVRPWLFISHDVFMIINDSWWISKYVHFISFHSIRAKQNIYFKSKYWLTHLIFILKPHHIICTCVYFTFYMY